MRPVESCVRLSLKYPTADLVKYVSVRVSRKERRESELVV